VRWLIDFFAAVVPRQSFCRHREVFDPSPFTLAKMIEARDLENVVKELIRTILCPSSLQAWRMVRSAGQVP